MYNQNSEIYLLINRVIFWIAIFSFLVLLFCTFNISHMLALKIALVCGISFLICTILRKIINAPRPQINDSIYTKKTGESFPSRHVFSCLIIAFSWMQIHLLFGIVLAILGLILGYARVKIGAHHVSDIVGSLVLALICAGVGYMVF